MSAPIEDLIGFLDDLLKPEEFDDYGPNGLQVPGKADIRSVVTAVSAGAELFERAAELGADLLLVHHGLFWNGPAKPLDAAAKRRLELLFGHEIALAAYHLPLDAHLEHGNNALLAEALGARVTGPLAGVGVTAAFDEPIAAGLLAERTRAATGGREPLVVGAGPASVATIGIVSGAGQGLLPEAIAAGLDAFLTGEASERNFNEAREGAIHFLAAGHYATETSGIARLGELLARSFGVDHTFLDVPNPI